MRVALFRQVSATAALMLATAAGAATWWWLHRFGPPTSAQAAQWLRDPLTPRTVLAAILVAATVIGAFVVAAAIRVALLTHAARRDRRRWRVRFRPPTVARSVTAALVGTAGVAGLGEPAAALAASTGINAGTTEPASSDRDAARPGPTDRADPAPATPATHSVRAAHGDGDARLTAAVDRGHPLGRTGASRTGPLTIDRDNRARISHQVDAHAASQGYALTAVPSLGTRGPVYEVRRADWLGRIAERYLGSFDRYPEIQRLNQGLITDVDHIEPTWRLLLPADAHDRGTRQHATGRLDSPRPEQAPTLPGPDETGPGAAPAPSESGPGDAPEPAPSPRPTDPSSGVASPSATPTQSGPSAAATSAPGAVTSPAPANSGPASPTGIGASPPPQPGSASHDDDRGGGVPLPGGWIGLPLAAALVAAGAMVWLRRRHRYVPQPIHLDTVDHPDLRPLPPVMTHIRRVVRRQAPDLLEPATSPPPTVAEHRTATPATSPSPTPIGPSGAELAGLGTPLPVGGLGLVGSGAESAARALLIATLSSGSPTDPDAKGHIVIPADTLTTLLGTTTGPPRAMPRLQVAADLSEALARVDELAIERRRLVQDYDAADLAGVRAADPLHPPTPPVLLISDAPPAELHARLTTTVHLGAPLNLGAVMLGTWPHGDTLTVHADGTTNSPTGRLAVLDQPTTTQLLQVIGEAHTGEPADTTPSKDAHGDGGEPTPLVDHSTAPDPASADPRTSADPQSVERADAGHSPSSPPDSTADRPTGPDTRSVALPPTSLKRSRPHKVRIQLLGAPAIYDRADQPVPGLRHHARELLVYLAVHRSGADLSQILESFWPTATVPRARERLSTEVGDLRRRIRLANGDKDIQPVINTGGRYHLDPHLVDVDVWHLVDTLRQAGAATDRDARAAMLRRAVDAHTGTLAHGYDYDWVEQPREQLRRHGIRARLHLAELTTDTDPAAAAELIRTAASLDPSNEDLARQAMRALARIGDTAGIQDVYRTVHTALNEIDEEPTRETADLRRELIGSRSVTDGGRAEYDSVASERDAAVRGGHLPASR